MDIIKKYLENNGYRVVGEGTLNKIDTWLDWYKGYVEKFHKYTMYNGINNTSCERFSLGMAKRICEDWANLIMNEKVSISTNDDKLNDTLNLIFRNNNFNIRSNQLTELTFALGTGAFVEYIANNEVIIDYIRADMIYPLSSDNGDIKECAFASIKDSRVYIQIHRLDVGLYVIENHYIDKETGRDIELPETIQEIVYTNSEVPFFQIIQPNIANNLELDDPVGISCYANAIDQIKGLDLAYDSYCNEFKLGKKKVIIPVTMAKIKMQESGVKSPVFDPNDTTFYAMEGVEQKGIQELNPIIRYQEHDAGVQKALDLLSFKVGLGNGRYRFESGTVKTATEIISEKSDLYQNLTKHEIVFKSAMEGLVKAIAFLLGVHKELEINVDFDDSIIEDKVSERNQDRQDLAAGIMRPEEYRAKWYHETLEEAVKNLPEQNNGVIM